MKQGTKKGNKSKASAILGKKQYLEFITAALSIPVLLTVILLNFNSIKNLKDAKPTDIPPQQGGFYALPVETSPMDKPLLSQGPCKKALGPIEITTPKENQTVTDNPTYVTISYTDITYCSAVWAYRINGGNWSDYDDRSLALYNLPQGNVKLELKVKSLASRDEKTLTRNFTYKGSLIIIPSAPIGSSSAN